MTKLEIEIHDSVMDVINKIRNIEDSGIELVIPAGAVILENILNLKLIKSIAEKENLTLQFVAQDEIGEATIEMLDDTESPEAPMYEKYPKDKKAFGFSGFSLPKIRLPSFKLNLKFKFLPLVILGVLVILGFLGYNTLQTAHKATVKIIVEAQSLSRSVTVKVKKGVATNADQKILKGEALQTTVEDTLEAPATGEKIVGEKAKGTVVIYNKTSSEKKFKKGTLLKYKQNDNTYEYTLTEDVTVAASEEDPDDPSKSIAGEEEVDIVAVAVGEDSNINKDKTMTFDDYKSADYAAKTKTDIKGGSSKKVKAVTTDDIKKLSQELLAKNKSTASLELAKKAGSDQIYIKGSEVATIVKEDYTKKADEEADTFSLKQIINVEGMSYSKAELQGVLDKISTNLIPEGYTLADKEPELQTEVLGNSTNSVLSATEADIQVTMKTFVITNIDTDQLKKDLVGISLSGAQRKLGGIRDIKTYKLEMVPQFLFTKMPSDPSKITVTIEKN